MGARKHRGRSRRRRRGPGHRAEDRSARQRTADDAGNGAAPNQSTCARPSTMDPIGFALENFDVVGTWRTEDRAGLSLDTADADGRHFDQRGLVTPTGTAAAARRVRADADRKTAHLCTRPWPHRGRHAGGSKDQRDAEQQQYRFMRFWTGSWRALLSNATQGGWVGDRTCSHEGSIAETDFPARGWRNRRVAVARCDGSSRHRAGPDPGRTAVEGRIHLCAARR